MSLKSDRLTPTLPEKSYNFFASRFHAVQTQRFDLLETAKATTELGFVDREKLYS